MRRSSLVAIALVVLLVEISTTSFAWHACEEEGGGGVCPDGNKCCPVYNAAPRRESATTTAGDDGGDSLFGGSQIVGSACISGRNASAGDCCAYYGSGSGGSVTGCGEGFECAYNEGLRYHYCNKVYNTTNDRNSVHIHVAPRYRLCTVPDEALTQVYGFQVDEKNASAPQLAYLSTMGAFDSGRGEDLQKHSRVETVVVVVHGSLRNVEDYLCSTNSALPKSDRIPGTSKTMVVAPWFVAPEDGPVSLHDKPEGIEPIRWAEEGPIGHTWRYGADSINLPDFSAYQVVDVIVERLIEDAVRFPSLKRIVVAGHSAGGQAVHRWALLSGSWAFEVPPLPGRHVHLRSVVANPKSFCFLDERRYVEGKFQIPPSDAIANCSDYNEWTWGFGDGNYLPTPYKDRALVEAGGKVPIARRYNARYVVYLAGEKDVLANGFCMEQMQGVNRRERSKHFFMSEKALHGGSGLHRRLVVAGVYHNHALMFQSPEGHEAMFGAWPAPPRPPHRKPYNETSKRTE